MTTLPERLAKALNASGKTKAELARACEVSPPSVADWFSGKTKALKGTSLIRAANFLNVRSIWLAEGKGPMRDDGVDNDVRNSSEECAWPFATVSLADVNKLSAADRKDLERLVQRFVAGSLASKST